MVEENKKIEKEKKEITEKKEEQKEKLIKVFTIPLRKAYRKTRRKRAKYAIRLIKEFLQRHLKTDNIKLGKHLNEEIWKRGIEKPPRRIKVSVTFADNEYRAELFGFNYEPFEEEPTKVKEGLAEKMAARIGLKALKKQEEEKMVEGKVEKDKDKEKETKEEKKE
jgi:large subunit ribosomal protein L31e